MCAFGGMTSGYPGWGGHSRELQTSRKKGGNGECVASRETPQPSTKLVQKSEMQDCKAWRAHKSTPRASPDSPVWKMAANRARTKIMMRTAADAPRETHRPQERQGGDAHPRQGGLPRTRKLM